MGWGGREVVGVRVEFVLVRKKRRCRRKTVEDNFDFLKAENP